MRETKPPEMFIILIFRELEFKKKTYRYPILYGTVPVPIPGTAPCPIDSKYSKKNLQDDIRSIVQVLIQYDTVQAEENKHFQEDGTILYVILNINSSDTFLT